MAAAVTAYIQIIQTASRLTSTASFERLSEELIDDAGRGGHIF
jgi:hypothetical protein